MVKRPTMREQRREKQQERTRRDILAAAFRAFGDKGFQRTTVQDIANEAGFGTASIYSYYASKDEIIRAMLETMASEAAAVFTETEEQKQTDFHLRLVELVGRLFAQVRRRKLMFLTLISQTISHAAQTGGEPRDMGNHPGHVMIKLTEAWMAENAPEGFFGNRSVSEAAHMLNTLVMGNVLRWLAGFSADLMFEAPEIVDVFLNGVGGKEKSKKVSKNNGLEPVL
jgi:AcrR family transcriptional regulator